jgi:mRNA-degrading endonuclease RelE of RelBE toxin-antitoxin system
MYDIAYNEEAAEEVESIRAFDRARILAAIGEHLTTAPARIGGRKKRLELGDEQLIYQLRVGDFRVFYDGDEDERLVIIRHVRRKGRRTTGAVL